MADLVPTGMLVLLVSKALMVQEPVDWNAIASCTVPLTSGAAFGKTPYGSDPETLLVSTIESPEWE